MSPTHSFQSFVIVKNCFVNAHVRRAIRFTHADDRLSRAVSVYLRAQQAIDGFYDDPITVAYGEQECGALVVRGQQREAIAALRSLGVAPNEVESVLASRCSLPYRMQNLFDATFFEREARVW